MFGWFKKNQKKAAPSPPSPLFNPPARESLAEADVMEGVVYEDQCTVIEGVVAPGQGGWRGPKEGYHIHVFSMSSWRRLGEALIKRKLTVLRPIPPYGGESYPPEVYFPDYSIKRLSVLLSKDQTRAVVDRELEVDEADKSLVMLSQQMREPVVLATEQFGNLTLNPALDWFEGTTSWNHAVVQVFVEKGQDDSITHALNTAKELWSNQKAWKRKVDEFAVEKMLPLKNESWLEDGEDEVTPSAFKNYLSLVSITLSENGQFCFSHDDGDLFEGHSIEISGNLDEGLTDANIQG